jgi:DeoR family transcriptional regulator of aga operon
LLIRARGGAMRPHRVGIDIAVEMKAKKHYAEKNAIGRKAAELISEGETIVLDSGTTTMEIAKNLGKFNNLTVVTNALNIALELANYPQIKIIVPGGFLRENSISLVGPIAENSISGFYCDKVFLGVDGIDPETGIYTPNIEEAHLNQSMIENTHRVIVVTDSSKFGKRSFAYIAPLQKIDMVITDRDIPEKARQRLIENDVEVIIAT